MEKVIYVHPTGNQSVRAIAGELKKLDMLASFHTSIASFPDSFSYRLGNISMFSEIHRRSYHPVLKSLTVARPWREAGRLLATKAKLQSLTKHESGIFSVDAVYQNVDTAVAKQISKGVKADAIYAYEDGAAFSFKAAKSKNICCMYDLPIGYWRAARQLMQVEREKSAEWAVTLTGFKDSEEKLARKDEELSLADHIFVASSFTAKTLELYPGKLPTVHVIPYGFPGVNPGKLYNYDGKRPLKVIYVGGLTQRKGISYLFEAVNQLQPHIELTVIGKPPVLNCIPLNNELKKHTWIPGLPNDQVMELMRQQDVLIFPSLFEGFGMVVAEAMAQGTPVITTDRTMGFDFIKTDENGWLIEAGSSDALVESLEKIMANPSSIERNGKAALETARLRHWEVYGNEIATCIASVSKC